MKAVRHFLVSYGLALTLILTATAAGISVYAVVQVQTERSAAILRNCQDQNARHNKTVDELDTLLKAAEKSAAPAKRQEIAASKGFTTLLIDRLAPLQNCQQVLAKSTSTK